MNRAYWLIALQAVDFIINLNFLVYNITQTGRVIMMCVNMIGITFSWLSLYWIRSLFLRQFQFFIIDLSEKGHS